MTGRRTFDKALAEPTYRRIIERGSWANYDKCWECGAEAGNCCVGDDGKEALEVCDGRVLVIDDKVSRCKIDRSELGPSRDPRSPPAQFAPCQHCGATTRLIGNAVAVGYTWCDRRECRLARSRTKQARRYPQRATRDRECLTCGKTYQWRAKNQKWCSAACRATYRVPTPPSDRSDSVPCVGCGVACAPKAVRWRTCGRPACVRERRRLADRERAHRVICDLQTVTVEIFASQRADPLAAE